MEGGFYESDFGIQPQYGVAPFHSNSHGNTQPSNSTNYYQSHPITSFDDEPPLLEELGIHIDHIVLKCKLILNPLSQFDASFITDADMAGPIIICLSLGVLLLLGGKVQFGQIYGQAIIGCLSIYFVFNLLSVYESIDLYKSVSILGYSLLPILGIAFLRIFANVFHVSSQNYTVVFIAFAVLTVLAVGCCTVVSMKIFTAVLKLNSNQKYIVVYPLFLFYTSFALITIF
mmetsp:Transcript_13589/g.24368  ORF Transcript_13589/g.24368 Transcript_13589/m.24368 type:complete len:230 (-) Transcript_13589:1255-1944(-)